MLRDHLGIRARSSEPRTEPEATTPQDVSVADVSPDFLAALPSDIQEEVNNDCLYAVSLFYVILKTISYNLHLFH